MSLIKTVKTNFTGGEIAPELLGRGDLRAYENGAAALRNALVQPTGGVTRRPGLAHLDVVRGPGRLIAFEFNTEQTYLLVVTGGWIDVYTEGTRTASLATPWTGDQLAQLVWTQSADTLLITHPEVAPRKITRRSHGDWSIAPWSWQEENGVLFQPTHKFADPDATLAASGTGGTVTLTCSVPHFDPLHVGTRFRLGGKEVAITAVASPTQATAQVKQALAGTSATKDWEEQAFSALRGWPVSVCFHQDRLVIGGSRDLPNRLWMSKSGDLFNFDLGEGLDDEAIEFALLSDQVNAVRAVFSGRHLQVFTSGAEWMVSGEPLTPSKIQLHRQTRIGSPVDRAVPPRDVDGATLFAARSNREIREFLFADVEQAYQATDLSMLARHLVDRPVDMDYDAFARCLHVVMADGSLATVTNYRAEQVTAWSRQQTDGQVLAVAVLERAVHLLVRRDGSVRLEKFEDGLFLDAAVTGESAAPASRWTGLDHLEGRAVLVLADQSAILPAEVQGGAITLADPATSVQVGLPYALDVAPLPPAPAGSSGQGLLVRLVQAGFRVLETAALEVDVGRGPQPIPLRRLGAAGLLDAPMARVTGDLTVRAIGWHRDATAPLWRIRQDTPLPCTVLSVTTDMKVSE